MWLDDVGWRVSGFEAVGLQVRSWWKLPFASVVEGCLVWRVDKKGEVATYSSSDATDNQVRSETISLPECRRRLPAASYYLLAELPAATPTHTTPTMPSPPPTSASAIPFLDAYFTTFDTGTRADLTRFYTATSSLTFDSTTLIGSTDITTFLIEAPKKIEQRRAKTIIDPIIGSAGNLAVLVTGTVEFGGRGTMAKFATSFVLGERKEGEEARLVILSQITSVTFEEGEGVDLEDEDDDDE